MIAPGASPVGQGGAVAAPVEAEPVGAGPTAPADRWFAAVLLAGGGLVAVGSALPWIALTGSGAAAATVFLQSKGGGLGGLDHQGAVTVLLGALAGWFGGARLLGRAPRLARWGGLAAGVATAALVAVAAADTSSLADPFGGAAAGVVQGRGPGIWVTLTGAVVLVAGSLAALATGSPAAHSSASTSSTDSMIPVSASASDVNDATTS